MFIKPEPEIKDTFWEQLHIRTENSRGEIFGLGDFNARVRETKRAHLKP